MFKNYLDSRKKHDMVAIRLFDPAEFELPKMGLVQLFNAETGKTSWANSNSILVQDYYTKEAVLSETKIKDDFKRAGIDLATFSTEQDYIPVLMKLFQRRG
jgi:hypothetical protein